MKLAHYVVRLYPRVWRSRYEEEFLALLEQHPTSLSDGIDLFLGALDAHLHPHLGTTAMSFYERMKLMVSTLRRSLLMIFCAYSCFIIAGMAFQKLTEYNYFADAVQSRSAMDLSFQLVVIGAIVALLAVLAGGLPIAAAVVKDALTRKRYGILFLLATPIFAMVAFIGTIFLLKALSPVTTSPFLTILTRVIFVAAFLGAVAISAGTVCFAVARSEISARLLRFAILPSLLITLSMTVMLGSTLVWGLSLRSSAPQLFNSNEGMFGTSTSGSWLNIVLLMAIATVLAAISLIRGFSARSALPTVAA